MQRPKENCPDCNTPQSFPQRTRRRGDGGLIEVYIACTVCTFDEVLRVSTYNIERLRRRLASFEAQGQREINRHGAVQGQTEQTIGALNRTIARLQGELDGG